jgi:hypothetical protein
MLYGKFNLARTWLCSEMQHRVNLQALTDVSEELTASIIGVIRPLLA